MVHAIDVKQETKKFSPKIKGDLVMAHHNPPLKNQRDGMRQRMDNAKKFLLAVVNDHNMRD